MLLLLSLVLANSRTESVRQSIPSYLFVPLVGAVVGDAVERVEVALPRGVCLPEHPPRPVVQEVFVERYPRRCLSSGVHFDVSEVSLIVVRQPAARARAGGGVFRQASRQEAARAVGC